MIRLALAFLLAWQLAVWAFGIPRFLLPGPLAMGRAMLGAPDLLARAALTTLAEIAAGFVIGAGLGVVLALLMGLLPALRRALLPVMTFSQTVPIFAFAPLLTLWLGYGIAPKIAIVALMVFFPVASSFGDGLARTPKVFRELADSMGATPLEAMRIVRIPAALPDLASGLRIAAVYAPAAAIVGEWVGGSRGLGAVMIQAGGRMKIDQMFAALAATVLIAVAFKALVSRLALQLERHAAGS
ncbi:ABC transporter permease [Paracoccus aerius]|uniref:ABC transporter permease n=1 Tax=Paracoccus aerius TaxID=1915382 RepID=A0ABS1S912_9RHOB|nr:ABC transporter permease [Paracoccus aerius]MBL3675193.1 ABC transporter permease [Paracoccus aerius]GHG30305.1 ABC transporter permease [Paracoccus aerius]